MTYTHKQIQDMIRLADYHINDNVTYQVIKAQEELASLIKMLCKLQLGEIEPYDIELLDELFDADIMILSMKRYLVPDKYTEVIFNKVVNAKLERELKRWGLNE